MGHVYVLNDRIIVTQIVARHGLNISKSSVERHWLTSIELRKATLHHAPLGMLSHVDLILSARDAKARASRRVLNTIDICENIDKYIRTPILRKIIKLFQSQYTSLSP